MNYVDNHICFKSLVKIQIFLRPSEYSGYNKNFMRVGVDEHEVPLTKTGRMTHEGKKPSCRG